MCKTFICCETFCTFFVQQHIIGSGRWRQLLSNHASQLLPSGKTAARSSVQNVVGDGGRKVITGVTDQHGRLQPESPGERFIVTLQGQQSEWAITAPQYTPGPN